MFGRTVAMYVAEEGNIHKMDKRWLHDKYLVDDGEYTVQDMLIMRGIPVPVIW